MKPLYESSTQPSKTLISPEQFYALVARFDRLEEKLEILISKVIDGVNNVNKQVCKKTTFDRAYPIVCKAKMRQNQRSTQFRKIRLLLESRGIKHVNDVTMPRADQYPNWIVSIYDKHNTRRGFISAFKEFFRILESRKIIPFDIAKHLETPKEKLHQSKTIEYEELTRMTNYARERHEELPSWGNAMTYMFMLVLRDTSCRVSEIKRVKWREIDKNERIIHIPVGKHQGEYYKFYGYVDNQLPKLLKEVKKWKKSGYVLSLENGKQYSIEGLRKIFYRIADELCIDSNPNAVGSCMVWIGMTETPTSPMRRSRGR